MYHPPASGGYGQTAGHYPQTHGSPYNQPHQQPYQPYQPPHGGYNNPSGGYNPSVGQPVIIQAAGQPYKPGIGQIAKEAFVFAGVSAGVNAAVNRILPGGIYGNSHGSSGGGGGGNVSPSGVVPTSNTQITYNNYYNGTAPVAAPDGAAPAAAAPAAAPAQEAPQPVTPLATAPGAQAPADSANTPVANSNPSPAPADASGSSTQNSKPQDPGQNNPSPLGFIISNDDIQKLTEDLFKKETHNANKHITVNLQGQKKDDSTTDDAPEQYVSFLFISRVATKS